ncbi:MAG: hypothetical protein CO032_07445 [Nitrosopumilales archaeon CG_4_9_14_0_2_um_filter_34_16]|nr:MAG: hypothetical protein CO032_07445 [Nitrosopumilales archaeon CG_4_9_14_0_2_um_filter_34_16]
MIRALQISSSPKYREVKEEWIQEIISQCEEQDVKVFFKQWGGFRYMVHNNIRRAKKIFAWSIYNLGVINVAYH